MGYKRYTLSGNLSFISDFKSKKYFYQILFDNTGCHNMYRLLLRL